MDENIRSITAKELAKIKLHSVVESFRRMTEEEFQALKASIKDKGLDEPIVVWNGMIVDGRHRAKAIIELGITCAIKDVSHLSESDMVGLVLRTNAIRRHLTTGQLVLLAHDRAKGLVSLNLESIPIGAAAKMFGVSPAYVNMLVRALKDAPELRQAIAEGTITVNGAKSLAELLQSLSTSARSTAVEDINTGKAAAVQAQAQAANLSNRTTSTPKPPRLDASDGIHGKYAPLFREHDKFPALLEEYPPSPELREKLVSLFQNSLLALEQEPPEPTLVQ